MAKQIISERVVSQKVLGSTNPVAKGFRNYTQKFSNIKGAIIGACLSPIIILVAFGLLVFGENLKKDSLVVEDLALEEADKVEATDEMHKIQGKVTDVKAVQAPEMLTEVLYYDYSRQKYEKVEKVETETVTEIENGQEVQKEIERTVLEDEWVDKETKGPLWGVFSLGNYKIEPDGAKLVLDLKTKEYWSNGYGDFEALAEGEKRNPVIGDEKIVLNYLPLDSELIVVGEISKDKITSGDVFIISNKSDTELVKDLKTSESIAYWGLKVLVWFLLTLGFTSFISPVLALLDFIPFAGNILKTIAGIISAITALIIVIIASLVVKFWWAFLILLFISVAILIAIFLMKREKKDKSNQQEKE